MAPTLYNHVFGVFGTPDSIVSDRDTRLTSACTGTDETVCHQSKEITAVQTTDRWQY
jgi:hypothetical protein